MRRRDEILLIIRASVFYAFIISVLGYIVWFNFFVSE